ncbi:VWA domain-containing protein [Viridibacterium curvum]|uniref:Substrate-binding domain-containing protein n=1 Tax=Viridibacterium curvum TaxID=1101404 RepID=A0ABP9QQ96_9RHOO
MRQLVALWLLCLTCLVSCSEGGPDNTGSGGALTVLAGSELKDIEPLLPQIEAATGLKLKLQYAGTLDAVEQLQSGAQFDFAWLASNRYALLTPAVKARVLASERTMISPVVLGVKADKARALGWDNADKPPTWAAIAKAAGEGRFRFGMSNPATSNTGFSAVLGLAAAISGQGDALELKDIDFRTLAAFAKSQTLTAGSSGWLAEVYQREADSHDGLVNYASVLHALNASGQLKTPLVLVYPKDGVITADYPFMLINPAQRAAYDKLVEYLRGETFQKAMSTTTRRQPVNTAVPSAVPAHTYFELPFPAKLEVINGLLDAYLNTVRRPADSTLVIDTSGSMSGERISQLQTALTGLTGADTSLSGRFAKWRERERITLFRFSDRVEDMQAWQLVEDKSTNAQRLQDYAEYVRRLSASGGTAIYSATQQAYEAALKRQAQAPDRVYSILLMTDGKNGDGLSADQFVSWFNGLPPDKRGIRVFAVLFGDARSDELETITRPTGGRVFDAKKSGLQAAFKEIRGYQ